MRAERQTAVRPRVKPGVFAGGDCASGPASVIKAIAAAKVVAANIDEYLGFRHSISCDVVLPEPDLRDRIPCGRVNMTEREACERVCDFEGVENCMTEAEARQQTASRLISLSPCVRLRSCPLQCAS